MHLNLSVTVFSPLICPGTGISFQALCAGSEELHQLEPSLVVEEQEVDWDGGKELELGLTNKSASTSTIGSMVRPLIIATLHLPAMDLPAAKVIFTQLAIASKVTGTKRTELRVRMYGEKKIP